ncbi:hypothetical protein [Methylobacter sp.]|uniref:hypothetical protein n=1 Tax=Methylobacter sp. TaxID=2051955 RepID=UPI003DA344DC
MFKNFIISFIIFVTSLSAWATPQTYKVTATVSQVYEAAYGDLPAPLKIGDEITMTYVMDDAKNPDYQDNWNIDYNFSATEGSMQVAWPNATIKTRVIDSMVHHHLSVDANNGNGVQHYGVWSSGPLENDWGNPIEGVNNIRLDLDSNSPYQIYTPWLTPDLNKFSYKQLHIDAERYQIGANVTSIVKEGDQPSAWVVPQNYKVTARVTNVYENFSGALPAPPRIGDEVTMTYVLDSRKSPDYQDSWSIHYSFNQNEGNMEVSWSNVTFKTSASQSMVDHHIGIDANNGNRVQFYHVGSPGPFESNGNPAPDVNFIGFDLGSDGSQYQTYTPWLTPDLSKFAMRHLHVATSGYSFNADVISIVNIPFTVWPEHGAMHPAQQFDVLVTAPTGSDSVEFFNNSMPEPLLIPCEIAPSFYGQTEIKFLCRGLDAARLQLYPENSSGVTIRLKNLATGRSLERVMNWRMVD